MTYVPLFQERWRRRPFWMLVGCILVNRTRWAQAKAAHAYLVRVYGKASRLREASDADLEPVLLPLGLSSQRSRNLRLLAAEWSRFGNGWHRRHLSAADVQRLPGCGQYAADSWAIFIEERRNVKPADKRLKEFLVEERRRDRRELQLLNDVLS